MVEWASLAACKVLFSSVFPRPCAVFPQDAEMGNNGPWLNIFLLRIYRGGRFWNEMGCGNTNSDLAAKGSSIQSEAFEVGVVHEGSIRDGCVVRGYSSSEFGTAIISADMVHARAIESIQQVYMCPTPTSITSQWSLSTCKGNTGKCGPLVLVLHHLSGWSPRVAWESSKGQNYRADSAAEA